MLQPNHIKAWGLVYKNSGKFVGCLQGKNLSTNHGRGVTITTQDPHFSQSSNFLLTNSSSFVLNSSRHYSNSSRKPSFFSQFIENIKQDLAKNKEMKENLKKFREEAEKLEQTDSLKKARAKFMTVESEASALKEKLGKVKKTVSEVIEEAGKTEIARKAGQITEELGKSARGAAETISEKGQKLGEYDTFRTLSQATQVVKQELDQTGAHAKVYVAPVTLRKRQETPDGEVRVFTADESTLDVELHKDSKFYESWSNFKNNNKYVNKILDYKLKYEESDNPVIRASRLLTDKMSDIVGSLFQSTEISETLTEIVKLDPSFDKTKFLFMCETDIIPNILEAIVRGDLEILQDWCHEGAYNVLLQEIKPWKEQKCVSESKVLDIENVDLLVGKISEQGPLLAISFFCQQIRCIRDSSGKVVTGDPNKVLRVYYVWVLSRDRNILDPKAAWRLLEFSSNATEQFL